MKEKKHISIQIAGQTFRVAEDRESEDFLRHVERNFNKIWAKWCEDFHSQNPQEVLAMVGFQYARYYYNLLNTVNSNEKAIVDFEKKLDEILLNVK